MQSNILVDTLSFGEQKLKLSTDFSKEEITAYLLQRHNSEFVKYVIDEFLKENFTELSHNSYRLNSEGYFRLLNHKNLQVARIGIWLALLLGIISIVFSVKTLLSTSEVKIEDAQFKQIQEKLVR